MKKNIFIIVLVILIAALSYSYYSYSKIKTNNIHADKFSKDLIDVVNLKKDFHMSDVTDFNWDQMIVFYPYTSREEMVSVIGHDWTTHSYVGYVLFQKTFLGDYPLDDDSVNKVVFLEGDKVILDVTFNRKDVDLTELKQRIEKDEAKFRMDDHKLILQSNPGGDDHD